MKKNISLTVMALLCLASSIFAQDTIRTEAGIRIVNNDKKEEKKECKTPRDGVYDRYLHTEKRALPYPYVHEKDVFWEKRIWREIDLRQKKNHTFRYAKRPFINILLDNANEGNITLYSTIDDRFTQPLTPKEVSEIGAFSDTITIYNPETFTDSVVVVHNELNPEDIKRYRIKEVWFFDEERSSLNVRILGIAPIINHYDDDGRILHEAPMFWAYYPELRPILAQEETFNPMNDAARLSWDNLFEARLFASYIIKESNVHDRKIKHYTLNGEESLVEGQKIHEGIRNFEHDLWSQ